MQSNEREFLKKVIAVPASYNAVKFGYNSAPAIVTETNIFVFNFLEHVIAITIGKK